jgi:hypothetical protein
MDGIDQARETTQTPSNARPATGEAWEIESIRDRTPEDTIRKDVGVEQQANTMSDSDQDVQYRPHPVHSSSRVEIDHFDPQGMEALKRTMSRASEAAQKRGQSPIPPPPPPTRLYSRPSDDTLAPGDGPFDFAKTLRTVIQRSLVVWLINVHI